MFREMLQFLKQLRHRQICKVGDVELRFVTTQILPGFCQRISVIRSGSCYNDHVFRATLEAQCSIDGLPSFNVVFLYTGKLRVELGGSHCR